LHNRNHYTSSNFIDIEHVDFVEELRKRLNILSTSVFLLNDQADKDNPKQDKYLKKINAEVDKIKLLISNYPIPSPYKNSINKIQKFIS